MEKIEFALKQADYFAARWDTRKGYEWKTTAAVWALLGAGIYAKMNKPFDLPWGIGAALVLLFALWLCTIWIANEFDKQMGRFYRDQAALIVRGAANLQPEPNDIVVAWRILLDGSIAFQLSSVICLVLVFYFLPSTVQPSAQPAPAATTRSEARPAPPAPTASTR